jgi:hypothetical protein
MEQRVNVYDMEIQRGLCQCDDYSGLRGTGKQQVLE